MVTSLVQLLCRTTKICWPDDDQFRSIVDDSKTFLEKGTSGGSMVGHSNRHQILYLIHSKQATAELTTRHSIMHASNTQRGCFGLFAESLAVHSDQSTLAFGH